MKKLGVVTFHRAINYGAILQVYALIEAVKEIGIDAKIIDYLAPSIISRHHIMRPSINPIECYRYLRYSKSMNSRFNNFQKFLSTIPLSDSISTSKELLATAQNFDAIICGSDQVWNTEITGNDFHFFLDFVPENVKKIAYAASFGFTYLPSNNRGEISRYLKRFNYISMREDAGADIVEELIGLRPPVVLDPTLLLPAKDWRKVSHSINLPEHYILLYSVGEIEKLFPIANEITSKLRIPVVVFSHRYFASLKNAFYLKSTGPNGFLWAFDKADYVITNSFHGTAFSVIFRKKFIVVPRTVDSSKGSGINSRMETLLNHLSLNTQFFSGGDPIEKMERVDYSVAEKKLEEHRIFSLDFLKSSLF